MVGINVHPWACGTGDALLSWQQSNHHALGATSNKAAGSTVEGLGMELQWVFMGESSVRHLAIQF